ncbi:sulfotransferase family 2 domain-containing protein [Oceanimonas smirnovii]|uniref:Sulfotransferase family 2 domain-containing protein n=1 Tax=Oceanimonas smirnovii TaxID=264574 RepID=A0ABW7P3Y3_9GAMM
MKGLYLKNGKVGYRYIPKVACTSIKEKIYEIENNKKFNREEYKKHIHQYMNHQHLKPITECDFRFIVVRDPVKRFLSAFSNRIGYYKELSKEYIKENTPELLNEIKIFNPNIKEFINNFHTYMKVPVIHHHFCPISDFLEGEDLSFFSKVYKMEKLNELESDLSVIYGTDIQFEKTQTGGKKIDIGSLKRSDLDLIINFYNDDYALLNDMYSPSEAVNEWKIKSNSDSEAPFIIWTLRRCGGTNLGEALFKASKFNAVQHEPFNGDRIFGHITRSWSNTKDKELLYKNIREVLEKKPLIKHCFEIIPDEVNEALVKISSELNYKHLFLYREHPTDRLLSLNYAQTTGIWGKEHKNTVKLDEKIFDKPVDINRLIKHEQDSRRKIKLIHRNINKLHANPLALTFESLYQGAYEYSESLVMSTFKCLGLKFDDISPNTLKKMLRGGGQGTKEDYLRFPGADNLKEQANKLPRLLLAPPLKIANLEIDNTIGTDHFELWDGMPATEAGRSYLSGIILTKDESEILIMNEYGDKIKITTKLPSPKIKLLYPDNKKSANSRFLTTPIEKGKYYIKINKNGRFKTKAQFDFI